MKLLIACDMEGITGVVAWNQVDPGEAEYQRFRHIMTADINAAVRGAVGLQCRGNRGHRRPLEQIQHPGGGD